MKLLRISCLKSILKYRLFSTSSEEIVIPKRIQRSPTDILKALSSTVKKDSTAPHYKYIDDPYLIPNNFIIGRNYALSRESGQKAALYFVENYPELFFRDTSEPKIEAFTYKEILNENAAIELKDLERSIALDQVENAIYAYLKLTEDKIEISDELRQSLLELVCFYNCKEPEPNYFEQKWYSQNSSKKNEWIAGCFAENLFGSMKKDSKSYSAIISGMAKYLNAEKAHELYYESKEAGIPLNLQAYNELILISVFLGQSISSRWEVILHYLDEMRKIGINPDLTTFNNILDVLCQSSISASSVEKVFLIMGEMKNLNISPSLGTYYSLLYSLWKYEPKILAQIVNETRNKHFSIMHPNDVKFFSFAMEKCKTKYSDVNLAYNIHELLNFGENKKLLGNALSHSSYYFHFFSLICNSEPFDRFYQIYELYVPNVFTPSTKLMKLILSTCELYEQYEILPKLFSDILNFHYLPFEGIAKYIVDIISKQKYKDHIQSEFVNIADKIALLFESDSFERSRMIKVDPTSINGELIGGCIKVYVHANQLEKATKLMKILINEKLNILGEPKSEELKLYLDLCLQKNQINNAINCLKYSSELGYTDVFDFILQEDKFNLSEGLRMLAQDLLNKMKSDIEDRNMNIPHSENPSLSDLETEDSKLNKNQY